MNSRRERRGEQGAHLNSRRELGGEQVCLGVWQGPVEIWIGKDRTV